MFTSVTIIGSGLIGASVLRAVKSRGLTNRTVVWDASASNAAHCLSAGWADVAAADLAEAVRDADLVLVATPADTVESLVNRMAPHLKLGAIVTDAASTKGHIARVGYIAMPEGRHFVGGHPMAGSEKNGPAASSPDLFVGRTCFITPLPGRTDDGAAESVAAFWRALGATPVSVTPDDHDEIVAYISHLPHLVAVALGAVLSAKPESWRDCAGGGLRDVTRIAGGDVNLWRAILMENRHEVARAVGAFERELRELREALEGNDDRPLLRALSDAREWRHGMK